MPKLSVVLTSYMRSERLDKCIKSILSQTFDDFELIIVDDASMDDTDKIVKKYMDKDKRIKYIKRETNFGTHTRPKNEGTKAATTDLIAYFDDDNIMLPDHLQLLYKYWEGSGADIVYGQSIIIDETGQNPPSLAVTSDINGPQSINILERNFIDTNQVLVKKSVIEGIGGWNEGLPRFADWELFARLKKIGASFMYAPIVITRYYVHRGMNQMKTSFMLNPLESKIWPDKTSYGPRPKLKVATYTLTKDRLDYTKQTFEALKKNTKYPYDHYIVDNGSTDGTVEWLKEHEKDFKKIKFNERNVGISEGSNQALMMMEQEYDVIIKIDNDCVIHSQGWLEQMVELYERNPNMILSPKVEGLMDSPGGVARSLGYMKIGPYMLGMAPHIGGIFVAAPAHVYKIFRWNKNDFLHSNQDFQFSQFCLRNMQYPLCYVENLICEHIDTTIGQKKKYEKYFKLRKQEQTTRYEG